LSSGIPNRIFVYGTLMKKSPGIRKLVECSGLEYVGEGKILGELYDLGEYPGAVKISGRRRHVHGEVYSFTEFNLVIPKLDKYEEVDQEHPEKGLFLRRVSTVEMKGGRKLRAIVYFYNQRIDGLRRIPSGKWMGAR